MSTKTVLKEIKVCDLCSSERDTFYKCTGCGKDICYACKEAVVVEYPHAVYFSGSMDGLYCPQCDDRLTLDPLHIAYRKIAKLRREATAFNEDLRQRADAAESALKAILCERESSR